MVYFASENCLLCLLQHSKVEACYWLFSFTFLFFILFSYFFIPIRKKSVLYVLDFVFIKVLTCWAVRMIQWFFWILNLIPYGDAEEIPVVCYIVEPEYPLYVILYLRRFCKLKKWSRETRKNKKCFLFFELQSLCGQCLHGRAQFLSSPSAFSSSSRARI